MDLRQRKIFAAGYIRGTTSARKELKLKPLTKTQNLQKYTQQLLRKWR